jgi:hypothetical protein
LSALKLLVDLGEAVEIRDQSSSLILHLSKSWTKIYCQNFADKPWVDSQFCLDIRHNFSLLNTGVRILLMSMVIGLGPWYRAMGWD